ncbi:KTSC domain-containing protein [Pedobacter sp. PLR]|uniref:KTSC domain-containing protein n=1 Tax=Pedobacter sp. PLR TaxID=2994465 RepID=UPI0022476DD8|nr:KTSC domain-containing protein [Pedobacter sp. PLR]MCX2453771.1 KTSC domain-containing protein [Pedobacter sp. PLR]
MPSTVIKHFNYNAEKCILYITFVSGLTYAYTSVPLNIVTMFKMAGSKGRYFNHFIKGHYAYKKIHNKSTS